MSSIPIFRDKTDIRPLPPIPDALVSEFQALAKTMNADGLTYFEKLQAVYSFMNSYGAFVATFAVCGKGCSHCCRMDVQMGSLEAHYIAERVSRPADTGHSVTRGHVSACPFLEGNGSCSVYEWRPFNCRTFHTLDDPKYCVNGIEDHQVYGAAGFGYGVAFYEKLAMWLGLVENANGGAIRDVRDWFPRRAVGES